MSNLVKRFDYVLDLAKFDESVTSIFEVIKGCAAKRAPPLAPPVFKEDLSTKTFTSPKADLETVIAKCVDAYEKTEGNPNEVSMQLQRLRADLATNLN